MTGMDVISVAVKWLAGTCITGAILVADSWFFLHKVQNREIWLKWLLVIDTCHL